MRTFRENHERYVDVEEHVTGTFEGSEKSTARTRRAIPFPGASEASFLQHPFLRENLCSSTLTP